MPKKIDDVAVFCSDSPLSDQSLGDDSWSVLPIFAGNDCVYLSKACRVYNSYEDQIHSFVIQKFDINSKTIVAESSATFDSIASSWSPVVHSIIENKITGDVVVAFSSEKRKDAYFYEYYSSNVGDAVGEISIAVLSGDLVKKNSFTVSGLLHLYGSASHYCKLSWHEDGYILLTAQLEIIGDYDIPDFFNGGGVIAVAIDPEQYAIKWRKAIHISSGAASFYRDVEQGHAATVLHKNGDISVFAHSYYADHLYLRLDRNGNFLAKNVTYLISAFESDPSKPSSYHPVFYGAGFSACEDGEDIIVASNINRVSGDDNGVLIFRVGSDGTVIGKTEYILPSGTTTGYGAASSVCVDSEFIYISTSLYIIATGDGCSLIVKIRKNDMAAVLAVKVPIVPDGMYFSDLQVNNYALALSGYSDATNRLACCLVNKEVLKDAAIISNLEFGTNGKFELLSDCGYTYESTVIATTAITSFQTYRPLITDGARYADIDELEPYDKLKFLLYSHEHGSYSTLRGRSVFDARKYGAYPSRNLWRATPGLPTVESQTATSVLDLFFNPGYGDVSTGDYSEAKDGVYCSKFYLESLISESHCSLGGAITQDTEFTIDGCLRFKYEMSGINPLISHGQPLVGSNSGWAFRVNDGYLEFVAGTSTDYAAKRSVSKIPLNQILYVSCDFFAGELHFVVNGERVPAVYTAGSSFIGKNIAGLSTRIFAFDNGSLLSGNYLVYFFRMFDGHCRNSGSVVNPPDYKKMGKTHIQLIPEINPTEFVSRTQGSEFTQVLLWLKKNFWQKFKNSSEFES